MTLAARMRSEGGWSDACILNVSSRGLLVYSSGTAAIGSFVEIRRGSHMVIGRVVWRKNQRLGVYSPQQVHITDLISDQTAAAAAADPGAVHVERRRIPRTADQHRARARAMEFFCALLVATALSLWALSAMHEAFVKPIATVEAALAPR